MFKISAHWLLVLFSAVCFFLMLYIEYDSDYRITSILPIVYAFTLIFYYRDSNFELGLGSKALVFFYAFRMCILPVICAVGNFYLEPAKEDYIDYYNFGVLLIAVECIIVFISLKYYSHYFQKKMVNTHSNTRYNEGHLVIKSVMLILTILVLFLQLGLNVNYYSPITSQAEEIIASELFDEPKGAWWYITDLLSTWWRPLVTIFLIYFIQTKKIKYSYMWILFISLLNVYFMSDRRIYALLVGGFALYYAMSITKSKIARNLTMGLLICSALLTLFFGFYSSATADLEMVARTFQRYFSGPTLNALALRVFDSTGVRPMDFIYLLLNDFQSFTAFFGKIELPNYYDPIFGMSRGLWVPMTVGSLCYFGPFFPFSIVFFVYFIKRCDYDAATSSSSLYKMIYYYIGVCVACFMIMYTVELIVYYIIATGILFRLMINFDKRIIYSSFAC